MRFTRTPEKNAASRFSPIAKIERPSGVAWSAIATTIARKPKIAIEYGIGATPIFVSEAGSPARVSLGRMICAIPRKSASVPIVTARDGRPRRVIRKPLNRPQAAPTTRAMTIAAWIGQPWPASSARTTPERPRIDATDRSISPVMMMSARGSAMIATSPMFRPTKKKVVDCVNAGDAFAPKISVPMNRRTRPVSQRASRRTISRRGLGEAASAAWGAGVSGLATAAPSRPEGRRDAHRHQPVEGDRPHQQAALHRQLPVRRDVRAGQGARDRLQQDRPEDGPDHAAAAAEDRDAADHDRGDHDELVARAGDRVDGSEVGEPERPGDPRDHAAERERREDPPLDGDARQARSLRVRPDRVEVPPGAEGPHPVPGHGGRDDQDDAEVRQARERPEADLVEPVRQVGRVDLVAAGPGRVDAADDVERRERHDEARHARDRHDRPLDDPPAEPDERRDQEDDDGRDVLVVDEHDAGRVGGDADDRADGQVHVAGDDDQRLPDGEQADDRGAGEDLLEARDLDEPWVLDRRRPDHERERHQDAELAEAQERLGDAVRAGALDRRGGCLCGADARHAASAKPVAARMIDCSSASPRANSPDTRPSKSTHVRSALCRPPRSSQEITSTATPSAARVESSRCTSALVPTSMPRVGSSTIRSAGRRASHFASTTFCWLPPESVDTAFHRWPYLSWSRVTQSLAKRRSAPCGITSMRRTRRGEASATLRSMARSITSPCRRRSSGTSATPAAIAREGEPERSCRPFTSTRPASHLSMPKIARATSLRPAPTRPAKATISPARTSKETSVNSPSRVSRSTLSTTLPTSASTFGKTASRSRPTMEWMTACGVSSCVGRVRTCRPSRRTVTRRQRLKTSSRRWLMNSTAAPPARSVSITPKRRSTSLDVRAAVGSSMMITRASRERALAISTSCWSAMESPRASRSGSMRTPSRSKSATAVRRMPRPSMRRPRASSWRPTKMFSVTDRSGKSVGSWKMISMPAACDWAVPPNSTSWPSSRIRPPSGR